MKGIIMQNFFKFLFMLCIYIIPIEFINAQDNVEERENMVEVRQTAMQAMWARLDRLSTLIAQPGDTITSSDGSSIVIGSQNSTDPIEYYALIHGKEATQDASEINSLLAQVEKFWPNNTSIHHVDYTNAEQLIWLIPEAFERYYTDALIASENLNKSFSTKDNEKIKRSVCMLALSCGRCHGAFRKVRWDNLRKEGRGWTGSYEACWTYRNEITLNSSAIRN